MSIDSYVLTEGYKNWCSYKIVKSDSKSGYFVLDKYGTRICNDEWSSETTMLNWVRKKWKYGLHICQFCELRLQRVIGVDGAFRYQPKDTKLDRTWENLDKLSKLRYMSRLMKVFDLNTKVDVMDQISNIPTLKKSNTENMDTITSTFISHVRADMSLLEFKNLFKFTYKGKRISNTESLTSEYKLERILKEFSLLTWKRPYMGKIDIESIGSIKSKSLNIEKLACLLYIFPFLYDMNEPKVGVFNLKSDEIDKLSYYINEASVSPIKILKIGQAPDTIPFLNQVFRMKKHHDIENIESSNPNRYDVLDQYEFIDCIGVGQKGIIFKVRKRDFYPSIDNEFAIKLQTLNCNDNNSVHLELKVHYHIMEILSNGGYDLVLSNVNKMYDWTKCRFSFGDFQRFIKIPQDSYEKFGKCDPLITQRSVSTYQFMVQSLEGNTLVDSILSDIKGYLYEWGKLPIMMIQTLSTHSQFQKLLNFTHFDFHPYNILVTRMKQEDIDQLDIRSLEMLPTTSDFHLWYSVEDGLNFKIPLDRDLSSNCIAKIHDFGVTHIHGKSPNSKEQFNISAGSRCSSPTERYKNGKLISLDHYNPHFDLHKLGCYLLMLVCHLVKIGKAEFNLIHKNLPALIKSMITIKWNNDNLSKKSQALSNFLSKWSKAPDGDSGDLYKFFNSDFDSIMNCQKDTYEGFAFEVADVNLVGNPTVEGVLKTQVFNRWKRIDDDFQKETEIRINMTLDRSSNLNKVRFI